MNGCEGRLLVLCLGGLIVTLLFVLVCCCQRTEGLSTSKNNSFSRLKNPFPWKYGDGFKDKGMYKRCEAVYGEGNWEKLGAIVYPKCAAKAAKDGLPNANKYQSRGLNCVLDS